ncbi:MAG: hypothetical protein Ct9H300mP21_10350 [Pseudomonadota bacterium]|nr:MAG: hypothetical protein Ct9H300mP21_10350 [Pseudomonadota bacterium]
MRDAQLLILGEPTASLDARAEHEVFHRFVELTFESVRTDFSSILYSSNGRSNSCFT